jgi:hypothetical protein
MKYVVALVIAVIAIAKYTHVQYKKAHQPGDV